MSEDEDEDEEKSSFEIKKNLGLHGSSSAAMDKKLKVSAMNELEKYKEI